MRKSVKVPVFLIVIVVVLIGALLWYLHDRTARFSESMVVNERLKLENERLSLMDRFGSLLQIAEPEIREPVGFKLST